MEEVKGYCSDSCREEEEEEEGAEAIIAITGSSSSSRSRLQLQTSQQKEEEDAAVGNLNRMNEEEEVDLMELRLGGGGRNSKGISEEGIGGIGSCLKDEEEEEAGAVEVEVVVEKEHMFDKVVTPSDVGKLNRLVIPKQHAEKYFPLDSSSNEKGLLLNFEDRNGKMWRFRYSYWNSSQSYVMTKGWSRFVKEKKLDAGDIVSFHRGRAELYRHRLYIDWRPRAHHSQYLIPQYHPPPFYLHPSSSLYSPQYSHLPNPTQYYNTNFYNNTTTTTTLHQQQQQQQQYHHPTADHLVNNNNNNNMNNPLYYLASSPITPPSTATGDHQHLQGLVGQGQQQQYRRNVNVQMNMIIDSVPVAHHHRSGSIMTPTNSGKRLRLFGVNMECDSSSTPPHVAMPNHPLSPSSTTTTTSVLFDLDPSNSQYHRH